MESWNTREIVEESRAAVLLGLTVAEIRRLSRLSGLGHLERQEQSEHLVFSYEELRRLCLLSADAHE